MEDGLDYCLGVLAAEPDQRLVLALLEMGQRHEFNFEIGVPMSLSLLLGLGGDDCAEAGAGPGEGDERATAWDGLMADGVDEGADTVGQHDNGSSGEDVAGTSAAAADNADGSAADAAEASPTSGGLWRRGCGWAFEPGVPSCCVPTRLWPPARVQRR